MQQHQAELAALDEKMRNELQTAAETHAETLSTREMAEQERHAHARETHDETTALLQQQIESLELAVSQQSRTAESNAEAMATQQRVSTEMLERTEQRHKIGLNKLEEENAKEMEVSAACTLNDGSAILWWILCLRVVYRV